MVKAHFFPQLFVCALILYGCSIEITQTPEAIPSPPTESLPSVSTSIHPTIHIPVTWHNLNLKGKLIYLSSTTDGSTIIGNIQMLDLVTGEIATLFSVPHGWIYYAAISRDAKWLVLSYAPPAQTDSASNRTLYIMPSDGSVPPRLLFTPPTADDHYPQAEWSPNGKYIYYVHYNHADSKGLPYEVYEIFRMAYPEGNPERIVDHAFWPRLSLDSTKLVYVTLDPDSGKNELFQSDADGKHPSKVALSGPSVPEIIDAPLFSTDEQSILFSAPSPGQAYQPNWFDKLMGVQVAKAHNIPSDWWSVPAAGGVPSRLTHIQAAGLFASISPDQRYLASVGGDGIFVMKSDGADLTQVISDPGVHGTVNWIP